MAGIGPQGKAGKMADQPVVRKGAVKAPHAPAKGDNMTARQPGGSKGNRNLPK